MLPGVHPKVWERRWVLFQYLSFTLLHGGDLNRRDPRLPIPSKAAVPKIVITVSIESALFNMFRYIVA